MSNLLLKVKGNRMLNMRLFAPILLVYDDLVVFRTRGIIKINELTLSYNQIAQVNLNRGLIFGTLEIINSGGVGTIEIKHVPKWDAKKAKAIIDQKIYKVHSREDHKETSDPAHVHKVEKSIIRLTELFNRGRITKKEFQRKKVEILKKID